MKENLKRSAWVASPVSNKIGTVLFALSAVMFILCFSNWMGMFSALKGLASSDAEYAEMRGWFVKAGVIMYLPFFILHAILTIVDFFKIIAGKFIDKEKQPVLEWV